MMLVKLTKEGQPFVVNFDHVDSFETVQGRRSTWIRISGTGFEVSETVEEIERLITKARAWQNEMELDLDAKPTD